MSCAASPRAPSAAGTATSRVHGEGWKAGFGTEMRRGGVSYDDLVKLIEAKTEAAPQG